MSTEVWGVIFFLVIVGSATSGIWLIRSVEREDQTPRHELDGFTVTHIEQMGWNYIADDPRAMGGTTTGYPTRGSAIRAARGALKDLDRRRRGWSMTSMKLIRICRSARFSSKRSTSLSWNVKMRDIKEGESFND